MAKNKGALDKLAQQLNIYNKQAGRQIGQAGSAESFNDIGSLLSKAGAGEAGGMLSALGGSGDPIGAAVGEISKRLSTAKQEFGSVMGSQSPTRAIAHFGHGLQAINPASDLMGPFDPTKVVTVLAESIDKLRDWNSQLHQSNMQFADFSASMAQVQAEQQARDIQLKRQQGNNRAESARDLAEAKSRLDRQLAPVEDAWAKLQNTLATWATTALSAGIKVSSFGLLDGKGGSGGADKIGDDISASQWMAMIGEDERETKSRRPKRLQ